MNNVAAGNFIDEETGESLNDVETVLNKLKIRLRDVNGEFRNSGEVLDEVAERWNTFDSVAQHAIATAFAGTRQQEKFTTLMEHYGEAMEYAGIATDSAGTAVEKFNAWLEGIQGKLNALKTAFQTLAMDVLNSELITGTVGFLTLLVGGLNTVIKALGGLNTVLYITAGLILTIKLESIVNIVMKIIGIVPSLINMVAAFATTLKTAWRHGLTLGSSLSAAFNSIGISANAAQIAVGALIATFGIALTIINSIKQAQEEAIRAAIESANRHISEAEAAKEEADSLDALIDKYEDLAKKNNGVWDNKSAETVKGIQDEIVKLVGDQATAIDLVNGKLETQMGILKGISGEYSETALGEAQSALTDAEIAIQNAMDKADFGDYDIGMHSKNSDYGRVETGTFARSVMGAGSITYDTLKVEFDTAGEFVEQYEAVLEYKNLIAKDLDQTSSMQVQWYENINSFLIDFKDVYETYISARDLVDKITNPPSITDSTVEETTAKTAELNVELKSAYDILEEVQDGYDGISQALTSVTSEGYLTADALSTLFKLEKDNALGGLELSKILEQDANGYKLVDNALEQYVQSVIKAHQAQYALMGAFATQEDKENAIKNLETLKAVFASLAHTQGKATDINKRHREELEKQQDAYDEQLDAYRDLIDIRKDLLETYEEELSYQKELTKRQRDVANLQTKLAIARLDSSAAGKARVRELEEELKNAQDELEDFTLEHAIDVLSEQLESQYSEYEAFIKSKLDEISELIENLDTSTSVSVTTDTSWLKEYLSIIEGLIEEITDKDVVTPSPSRAGKPVNNVVHQVYHTGGLVGGKSSLHSNEEFAKLLKGEFVSTPAQMKRFMEDTLPKIANYTSAGNNNEFNAPLIEIICESVTTESLPQLKQVVNEAVKEIQKQLDDGMSRAGFKRPVFKRLT